MEGTQQTKNKIVTTQQLYYNPTFLSKSDIKNTYTIRKEELDELVNHIKGHKPQEPSRHVMVVGSRGMGKTTLGLRLSYEIEDSPNLRNKWQPVRFMEESYGISDAGDFWLSALNHLSQAVGDSIWSAYSKKIANSESDGQILEAYALDALNEYCDESGKRLLLFVDNIDNLFERFKSKREVHAIRAALMKYPKLFLLGTAQSAFTGNKDLWAPFYGLFQLIQLRPLSSGEAMQMLTATVKRVDGNVFGVDPINAYGNIEVTRLLTGGNTRSISIAIQMLAEDPSNDAHVLDGLIDAHTPYFKAQIEKLPVQAGKVLDQLSIGWHPMLAREVAAGTRLGTSQTSAQLRILIDRDYVEEVRLASEKRVRYELRDRLLNIYYLSRLSWYGRKRLRWFVAFLYSYCNLSAIRNPYYRNIGLAPTNDRDLTWAKELKDILTSHVMTYGNITDENELIARMLHRLGKHRQKSIGLSRNSNNPSLWVKFGKLSQQGHDFNNAFQAYGRALGLILSNVLDSLGKEKALRKRKRKSIDIGATDRNLIADIVGQVAKIDVSTLSIRHRLVFGCLNAFIGWVEVIVGEDALAADALRNTLHCASFRKSDDQEEPESKALLLAIILSMIPMLQHLGKGRVLEGFIEDGVFPMIAELRNGNELRARIDRCGRISKSAGTTLSDIVFIGAVSTGMKLISDGHRDRAGIFFSWIASEFSFSNFGWNLGVRLAKSQVGDGWYFRAEAFVDKALAVQPDDPENHFFAFIIASKIRKWRKALKHLEECLNFDPKFGKGNWSEVAGLLVQAACAGEDRRVSEIMESGSLKNELEPLWYALQHEGNLHATPLPREIVDAAEDIRSRLRGEA